jgi:hypothetical protein
MQTKYLIENASMKRWKAVLANPILPNICAGSILQAGFGIEHY